MTTIYEFRETKVSPLLRLAVLRLSIFLRILIVVITSNGKFSQLAVILLSCSITGSNWNREANLLPGHHQRSLEFSNIGMIEK